MMRHGAAASVSEQRRLEEAQMVVKVRFCRVDPRVEQYEAMVGGLRLVVVYNDQWESWFWYVDRSGTIVASGSAPDSVEAQERAIRATTLVN